MIKGICAFNMFLWMSAIESDNPLPVIMVIASTVVALAEKKISTISLPAKNRAKSKKSLKKYSSKKIA